MTAFSTKATRAGIESDTQYGAVVPPIHLSTNYTFDGFNQKRAYDYSRSGNPTRDILNKALADLEEGAGAVVTSSGMAAVALVLELVPIGGLVIAAHDCYGGTWRLLEKRNEQGRIKLKFVDLTNKQALDEVLKEKPSLVWIETPSNPLLRITDIQAVTNAAKKAEALSVVDNTFLSPALQKPLTLGADIVVHSTTKYINGHSDVVGGATVAKDTALIEQLKWWANCLGLTGAPFDSFLTLRGLRTLDCRLRVHQENAQFIAEKLTQHSQIKKVYYPGLSTDPGHQLAKHQQIGFGAMLSFELKGNEQEIKTFLENLTLFSLAESLGSVESLIAHPATMTHAAMAPEARHTAGISDNLLRLSVGIENKEDLWGDIENSLNRITD